MDQPFIMVISEDPRRSHLLPNPGFLHAKLTLYHYVTPADDVECCMSLTPLYTCNTCFECAYIKLISEKGRHSEKTKVSDKKDLKNRNNSFRKSFYIVYTNFRIFMISDDKFNIHRTIDKQ